MAIVELFCASISAVVSEVEVVVGTATEQLELPSLAVEQVETVAAAAIALAS